MIKTKERITFHLTKAAGELGEALQQPVEDMTVWQVHQIARKLCNAIDAIGRISRELEKEQ